MMGSSQTISVSIVARGENISDILASSANLSGMVKYY